MPYATLTDMVQRFGQVEMIRLSATSEMLPDAPLEASVMVAIRDMTGVIESYLRARYALPLSPVPPEIVNACCILARARLGTGNGRTPTDQMLEDRRRTIEWLELVAKGLAQIEAPAIDASSGGVIFSDREREFTGRGLP